MLLPALAFSLVAAAAVWFAGRRDSARDPWLTLLALGLLAGFPLLFFLPKVAVLPPSQAAGGTSTLAAWLPGLWAVGVVLAAGRLVVALALLARWRRRSQAIATDAPEGVEVRLLPGVAGPVAAGILKPVVFVPESWADWTPEVREAVIAHEAKHHQRRDPLWRAIAAAACTLHWFNPLVWWMARRLADQCEFACDAAVLADGMRAERYANVLCDLAAASRSPATALAMAHEAGLEARVRRMFSVTPQGSRAMVVALLVLIALVAVGLVILKPAERPPAPAISREEIQLRLTADPFPGEKATSRTTEAKTAEPSHPGDR